MSKSFVHELEITFGDCDPAGIVFYPNYQKWMDASSHHFFLKCGLPPFRELERTRGILGHPLLEIQTRFFVSATYGEKIQIHTNVKTWSEKVFTHQHVIKRGDEVLCEGSETRVFVVRHPQDPSKIKSIKIPQDIIDLWS